MISGGTGGVDAWSELRAAGTTPSHWRDRPAFAWRCAMRRLVAILAALVLSLSLSVPIVAAQEGQYVTGITVTSATVNKMGEVHISGYLYCQGFQEWDDRNVEVQGQLIQAFGRKTT